MYVPGRSPTPASREALLKTITHRVLKDARVAARLRRIGVRDPESVVRPVAEVALEKALLKNAAANALRKATRSARAESGPVRIGGFYVR